MMTGLQFIINSLLRPSQYTSLLSLSIRQTLSGAVTSGVDLAVFQAGLCLSLPIWVSATVSFVFAVVTNFSITRFYVFGETSRQRKSMRAQAILYVIVALVSLGIIQIFLYIFAVQLGWAPLPVKIMAIPVVFVWTVLSGKYLVFNKREK